MTKEVYTAALRGIFDCCNQDNRANFLDKLKGVIVDWATAQVEGLKAAVGNERAEELLRGCQVIPSFLAAEHLSLPMVLKKQVHFLRAVQRTADKVCCGCSSKEKQTFIKLGSLIMMEEDEDAVKAIFAAMAGERPLQDLPRHIQQVLPSSTVNTKKWKAAKTWTEWWMRPLHLSKCKHDDLWLNLFFSLNLVLSYAQKCSLQPIAK